MNEASLKVLRMVADGKLSAEQADELLTVLDDERDSATVEESAEPEEQATVPHDHAARAVTHDIDDIIAMKSMDKETA